MSPGFLSSLLPPPGGARCVQSPPKNLPGIGRNRGMPRRVAGAIWAIRITMDLLPEEEEKFRIPNTVCVYHAGGSRAKAFKEKPHYHLYYNAGDEVVKEKVQELVKSSDIVKKYYKASNGFWSVETSPEYDLESYWRYVWDNFPLKKQRLIWWDIPEPQLPIPESLVYAEPSKVKTEIVYVKPTQKTSAMKQHEFYIYCKEYFETKPQPIEKLKICYLLIKYCESKGFTPESSLSTWARYAYFNLLGKQERKESRMELAHAFADKFF